MPSVVTQRSIVSAIAGHPVPKDILVDIARLDHEYYVRRPDVSDPDQRVRFGTNGHRGSPLQGTFTEDHILAITQAICDWRQTHGTDGPLFLGKDTHALSRPAQRTALEVLAANRVETIMQADDGVTPTPVISRAILVYNQRRRKHMADGIIITPSHNPPEDGGFKYNSTHGGPADTKITQWVEDRANDLLGSGNIEVKRVSFEKAMRLRTTHKQDFVLPYVRDLANVVDMESIRGAGLRLAVDPLGGASLPYWELINSVYGLDIEIVNQNLDPTFSFMMVDHDGRVRMDCSSRYAMAGLVGLKDMYRVAFANDPDADRHGIVTASAGLIQPNHYLAVAIHYLLTHRPQWPRAAAVGKSIVSSSLIDRVVHLVGGQLCEVPVGFTWFTQGLFDGSCSFGCEESAGATFLRRNGTVWTTDKDGLVMSLLAAEITADMDRDPGQLSEELTAECGASYYSRIQAPATAQDRARFKNLSPECVRESNLGGEPILAKLTRAPGNNAPIDGLKVVASSGWFAARPSGTESSYMIYAESLHSAEHLEAILTDAREIVDQALAS